MRAQGGSPMTQEEQRRALTALRVLVGPCSVNSAGCEAGTYEE